VKKKFKPTQKKRIIGQSDNHALTPNFTQDL
jgi:hypothetical protein